MSESLTDTIVRMTQKIEELEDAIIQMIKAWESLEGNTRHSPKAVENWICGPMYKEIMHLRKLLNLPVPLPK